MARTTYVLRGGELIDKALAHVDGPARSAPNVISDNMDPIRSHADGRMYDSKSAYRTDLRARGYVEVGNERAPFDRRPSFNAGPVAPDIKRAIQELSGR